MIKVVRPAAARSGAFITGLFSGRIQADRRLIQNQNKRVPENRPRDARFVLYSVAEE